MGNDWRYLIWRFFGTRTKSNSVDVAEQAPAQLPPTGVSESHLRAQLRDVLDAIEDSPVPPSVVAKGFDWSHYNQITEGGINGMFQAEFATLPNLRTLKSLYPRECWIGMAVDAIVRQFYRSTFILVQKKSETQQARVFQNPALDLLNSRDVSFHAEVIADLVLTGQAYVWTRPDGQGLLHLPSERMEPVIQGGKITSYKLHKTGAKGEETTVEIPAEEVTFIRTPNPFSRFFGLPPLLSAAMPILIDRYSKEYVISFFIRGGTTTGVCETESTNADQITRMFKSIQAAFSTRRNMHSDKILPSGVKWKDKGLSFSEIMLDVLQEKNARQITSRLGVPPVLVGMTESVNYANAEAQMQQFYRETVVPWAALYCSGLQNGSFGQQFNLQQAGWTLEIDFSNNRYVSDYDKKLAQDKEIAPITTVNERRTRLGFEPLPDGDTRGDLLGGELSKPVSPLSFGFEMPTVEKPNATEATPQKETPSAIASWKAVRADFEASIPKSVDTVFDREFGAWEQIVLDNMESKATALAKIHGRAQDFSRKYADTVIDYAMNAYDAQMARARKSLPRKATKADTQTEQDRNAAFDQLRDRAKRLLEGQITHLQRKRFVGYSETMTSRAYDVIAAEMEKGANADDIARAVRKTFGEFYAGQALTIVRTEYASSLAEGQAQYSKDLGSLCTTVKKVWLSVMDSHTRDSHAAADGLEVEGTPEHVEHALFSSVDSSAPDLRYPKDERGTPDEIINCRCQISYEPVEWKDE